MKNNEPVFRWLSLSRVKTGFENNHFAGEMFMSDYVRCPECGQMVHNFARSCPYCRSWVPTDRNNLESIMSRPHTAAAAGISITLLMAAGPFVSLGRLMVLSFLGAPIVYVVLSHFVGKLKYETQIWLAVVACGWWVPLLLIGGLWFAVGLAWGLWNL
jgi:hypothetical protein